MNDNENRPCNCVFCLKGMYYIGDPNWEPEVEVDYVEYHSPDYSFQSSFYAHLKCWREALLCQLKDRLVET